MAGNVSAVRCYSWLITFSVWALADNRGTLTVEVVSAPDLATAITMAVADITRKCAPIVRATDVIKAERVERA